MTSQAKALASFPEILGLTATWWLHPLLASQDTQHADGTQTHM